MNFNRNSLRNLIEGIVAEEKEADIEKFKSGGEQGMVMVSKEPADDNVSALKVTSKAALKVVGKLLGQKPPKDYFIYADNVDGVKGKLGPVRYSKGDPYTYKEVSKSKKGARRFRVISGPSDPKKGARPIGAIFTPSKVPEIEIEVITDGGQAEGGRDVGTYFYGPYLSSRIADLVKRYDAFKKAVEVFNKGYLNVMKSPMKGVYMNNPNWDGDWDDGKSATKIVDAGSKSLEALAMVGKKLQAEEDMSEGEDAPSKNGYFPKGQLIEAERGLEDFEKGFVAAKDWILDNGPKADRDQGAGSVWQAVTNSENKDLIRDRDEIIETLKEAAKSAVAVRKILVREKNRELSPEEVETKIQDAKSSGKAQGQYGAVEESLSRGSLLRRRYRRY